MMVSEDNSELVNHYSLILPLPASATTATVNGSSLSTSSSSTFADSSTSTGHRSGFTDCRSAFGGANVNSSSTPLFQPMTIRNNARSTSGDDMLLGSIVNGGGGNSSSAIGMIPGISGYGHNTSQQQRFFNNMPSYYDTHTPSSTHFAFSQKSSHEMAMDLAQQGNLYFAQQNYKEAVRMFSEAIKMDPLDARFYGNRGYCFEICGSYELALEDAEKAIALQPTWPKGFFRKGCVLEKLKRLSESEKVFDQLLRLDSQCQEAQEARYRVMTQQLVEMGLPQELSAAAVRNYGSVKTAADSLLQTRLNSVSALSEVFDSDDDEALLTDCWSKASTCSSSAGGSVSNRPGPGSVSHTHSVSSTASGTGSTSGVIGAGAAVVGGGSASSTVQQHRNLQPAKSISPPAENVDPLMDPKNPLKWPTLWVGNLNQAADEKELNALFSRYGKLKQFQLMLEKHCAFLTYMDWKQAGEAMRNLQGMDVKGQRLLVRFPDRALEAASNTNNSTIKAGAKTIGNNPALARPGDPPHSAVRGTVILRKAKK